MVYSVGLITSVTPKNILRSKKDQSEARLRESEYTPGDLLCEQGVLAQPDQNVKLMIFQRIPHLFFALVILPLDPNVISM